MPPFHLRLSGDDLRFSAAHFITLADGTCERLHGHDFRVTVELDGPLNEQGYVVDFVAVRAALRAILDELDHRVLLPREHPSMRVEATQHQVEVTLARRRWVFPAGDCLLLPLRNTTSELLAHYVGQRLLQAIEHRCGTRPARLRVEVSEGGGSAAGCHLDAAS